MSTLKEPLKCVGKREKTKGRVNVIIKEYLRREG